MPSFGRYYFQGGKNTPHSSAVFQGKGMSPTGTQLGPENPQMVPQIVRGHKCLQPLVCNISLAKCPLHNPSEILRMEAEMPAISYEFGRQ